MEIWVILYLGLLGLMMYKHVGTSLLVHVDIPRNEIAGSCGICIFKFSKQCQIIYIQMIAPFHLPPSSVWGFSLCHGSHKFLLVSIILTVF